MIQRSVTFSNGLTGTEQLFPREGYFFWILGMMFVLFSARLGRPADSAALASAAL